MIDPSIDIWSLLVLLGLVLMAGAGMWAFIPRWHGIPPSPSRPRWIRRALRMVNVREGETVYDLGAGDGRVLLIAAREFGAQAVGFEIEPLHCAVAWLKALFGGVISRVSIHRKDLYKMDLSKADVVFMHLNPVFVENLRPLLASQLRAGARVVSLDFPLEGWEPTDMDIGYLIFAYEMPPRPGDIDSFLHKTLTPPGKTDSSTQVTPQA